MQRLEEKASSIKMNGMDLVYTLGTLFSLKWILLQFTVMWTFAGPISLLSALAVATWCLKKRNETWGSLGLFETGGILKLSAWTIGALIVTIVIGSMAGSVANELLASSNDIGESAREFTQNRFINVPGNTPVYIYWLIISWVIGGFTEEMLFRGFMILRFEKVFAKFPYPTVLAILVQAVIFGQQHMYYQGVVGLFETGFIAIISGIIFILCKRRLWPLILSHALANTLGMTMLFLGNS